MLTKNNLLSDFLDSLPVYHQYKRKRGWVYILGCVTSRDNIKYYTGSTTRDLVARLREHAAGRSKYTSTFKDLFFVVAFHVSIENCRKAEYALKRQRSKKYSIIRLIQSGNSIAANNVFRNVIAP